MKVKDIKFRIKKIADNADPLEDPYYMEFSLLEDFFVGETWHPQDDYDYSTLELINEV